MSTSRFFGMLAVVVLAVAVVLTVRAESTISGTVSNGTVALDQLERHPGFINLSAALAEQVRLAYRQGEWAAGSNVYAPLDAHERHASATDAAEQARLEYRRGEWYAGSSAASPEFDVEQARLQWRAGK